MTIQKKILPFFYLISVILAISCSLAPTDRKLASIEKEEAVNQFPLSSLTYWPYEAEGCLNTVDQYLKESSNISGTMLSIDQRPCHMKTGRWFDYFSSEELKDAAEVIVAPVIPLAYIQSHYPSLNFSNIFGHLHDKELLIIFKKGSESEQMYLQNAAGLINIPSDSNRRCEFLGMWMDAKQKWNIPFENGEKEKLLELITPCISEGAYDRRQSFGDWRKTDAHQCDTRTEAIMRDSSVPTEIMSGYENQNCTSHLTGKWIDPYSAKTFTTTHDEAGVSYVDIDHIVPLKHAYFHNAWKWPHWKKKKYANYLDDPFHLLTVDATENRSKGDNAPGEYLPSNESFQCRYIEIWIGVKLRWAMKIDDVEKSALQGYIEKCDILDKNKYMQILNILSQFD